MRNIRPAKSRRRGAVTALTVFSLTTLVGFMALAVDVGLLYNARAEMQRGADAAALAGVAKLASDSRINGGSEWSSTLYSARTMSSTLGYENPIQKSKPTIDLNTNNVQSGDVLLGQFVNPDNLTDPLTFPADTTRYNTVLVRVRRNDVRNGPVPLFFAHIFGIESTNMEAMAAATLDERIVGFKIKQGCGNPKLLPFALSKTAWDNLVAGGTGTTDAFTYNSNGTVTSGGDGIRELNLYPGGGTSNEEPGPGQFPQLGPGNYGTVDIGSANNSSSDVARQILYGPNESDLAYHGGELRLNSDSHLMLNGDTGLSAGFKDELEAIKGQGRIIPIFDQVSGNGNNAMYRIVAFAGIRILDVDLTKAMDKKRVIIQPAAVVDCSAETSSEGLGHFVYAPVRLTR